MKPFLNLLGTLCLVTLGQGVTHHLNSDEDSAPDPTLNRPVYGPFPVAKSSESVDVRQSRPHSTFESDASSSLDSDIDATVPRNVRYTQGGYTQGGYGYNSGGNHGWSGGSSNPGYSSGGIVCTVCSNYDAANAQRCCAFGYRQCCNVGVYSTHPVGGAGYNYVSPSVYSTGSTYEKPGSCGAYSNFGYTSGGFVNQNSGYYATRRQDPAIIVRVRRDAPVRHYGAYGPPHNSPGYTSWGSSQHGGNGYPPSSGQRPGSCFRDYDCPGNQKCCSGVCSNPVAVIG